MKNSDLKGGLALVKKTLKEGEYKRYCLAGRIAHDIDDFTGRERNDYRGVGTVVTTENCEVVFEVSSLKATRFGENFIYLLGSDNKTTHVMNVDGHAIELFRYAQLLAIIHVK